MTEKNKRFDELMENLSERQWHSNDGVLSLEEMSESHIQTLIGKIEDNEIDLMGLEDDYLEMFREELEDRGDELNFD
jgi:hypothetical protein